MHLFDPDSGEEPVDLGLVGQVGPHDRRAAELARNGVRPLLALVVVDDHPRTLGGEGARAGGADPARGARDDDAATVEAGVHATNLVEPGLGSQNVSSEARRRPSASNTRKRT